MSIKDWIISESARKEIKDAKDAAFIAGYVTASFVSTIAVMLLHHWGIV